MPLALASALDWAIRSLAVACTCFTSTPSFSATASSHTSDSTLVSKSLLARISERADSRFWLSRTNVDRKIASSETIRVSRPNGNGSNVHQIRLPMHHRANQNTWR